MGNSFDILRVAAALAVIFHHTYPLNGRPALQLLGADFGAFGVGVFFVVSGYLVTESYRRSGDAGRYLAKRALRIWPGLVVSLILTAVVLGPLVTALPTADYFADPQWALYILRNTLLYPVTYDLPGVFAANPAYGVNGSLWTLRLEFTAYLALAGLGAARWARPGILAGLAFAAAAGAIGLHASGLDAASDLFRIPYLALVNGFLFLAGAVLRTSRIRPALPAALLAMVLLATPAWFLGLPLIVARLGALQAPRLPVDLSYGLYIYSFPLQQWLAERGQLNLATSLAAALPCALASWVLVERPALGLKARLEERTAPLAPLSPAAASVD